MDRLRAMEDMGVAVVGSINVDLAAFGSPLPRPGETVIGSDFEARSSRAERAIQHCASRPKQNGPQVWLR